MDILTLQRKITNLLSSLDNCTQRSPTINQIAILTLIYTEKAIDVYTIAHHMKKSEASIRMLLLVLGEGTAKGRNGYGFIRHKPGERTGRQRPKSEYYLTSAGKRFMRLVSTCFGAP